MRPIEFKFDLGLGDLPVALINLNRLHNKCSPCFCNTTRSVEVQSHQYLEGLLLNVGRGNISRYSERVRNCNNQSLNHFISDSPWSYRRLIDYIQINTTSFIGDWANGFLHLDESGISKSGKCSVGTKRQYNGRLGKVDNCQVGVFLGYVNGSYRTLIDAELYLPEDWCEDPERRKKCGVPEDVVFKTKAELGLEMLLHARENNVPFDCVGMDAFYGQQPWLRDKIDSEGITYVADIPANTRVWLYDGEKDIKYQFSNAPIDTTVKRLAQMSYSRYWIERAFQDAKGTAGLADYQVRSWTGWHHHITMSLLAMLAILMIRIDLGKKAELLTVQDVKGILEVILPQKEITAQEVLSLVKKRHKQRYSARMSHHKRQRLSIKCANHRYRSPSVGTELM